MIAQISKKQLSMKSNSQLIQGTVGEKMNVEFSDDWSALSKTAVFAAGDVTRDVIISADEITIPWELLTKAGHKLCLSFHGALPDGSIVLRTNIVSLGTIQPSLMPSGEEPEAPSPVRADQIQAIAEQALAAAQEVSRNAAAGLFDGSDGVSPFIAVQAIAGGHRITITDVDGSRHFDVMDGTTDGGSSPSVSVPLMDGVPSVGISETYARGDHVHPSDTSRLAANQGTTNAGKFMVVGSDGIVAPVTMQTWQGGSY